MTVLKLQDVPFFSLSFQKKGDKYTPIGLLVHYRFLPNKYFHQFRDNVVPSDIEKAVAGLKQNVKQLVQTIDRISFEKKYPPYTKQIRTVYILPTTACNLRCKYCFVTPLLQKPKFMTVNTAEQVVEILGKTESNLTVIFYGGEPLLNFRIIRYIIENLKDKQNIKFAINTNATLITDEIAVFFKKYNVSVSVSIDGPKDIHDQMRVDKDGYGSFDDVLRGIEILREHGINYSFSVTVGPHNVDKLENITEFLCSLGSRSIGFNVLKELYETRFYGKNFTPEYIAYKLYRAMRIALKYGCGEDRIYRRRIQPFISGRFWTKDCSGAGNEVAIAPNGRIGTCHALEDVDLFFPATIFEIKNLNDVYRYNIWHKVANFTTIDNVVCTECPAVSICGRGCYAYTYLRFGDMNTIDGNHCRFITAVYSNLLLEIHSLYSKRSPEILLRSVTYADKYTVGSVWEELRTEGLISEEYPENMVEKYMDAYIKGYGGMWILTNEQSVPLGFLTLSASGEIGIYLKADIRGKSLGKYLMSFVTGISRLQQKKMLFARTHNQALIKILKAQGFAPEGDNRWVRRL